MAEVTAVGMSREERMASDRRKAAAAAVFLARVLGIQAEPGFDLASSSGRDGERFEAQPYGEYVYKDVFDMGRWGEQRKLQLLLVDECGSIVAESAQLYTVGAALGLLERLPLPLYPKAERWLQEALGLAGAACVDGQTARQKSLAQAGLQEAAAPC